MEESKSINYRYLLESAVDWKKKLFHEKPFFEYFLKKKRANSFLDLRSGSGKYLLNMYGLCNNLVGVESDIILYERAKKSSIDFPGINFVNSSFTNIPNALKQINLPSTFDVVFLTNNHLATIINTNNIVDYLKKVNEIVSKNGIFLMVGFNYNKLLKDQDYSFSKQTFHHEGSLYALSRSMKIMDEELISYSCNIFDSSGHIFYEHKELQYPLTKKRIIDFLEESGFKNVEFYGDFSFTDFDVDKSKKIIVVAYK